ncbi:hypothetical protein IX51_06370 [uncultured archaeon]|nr:hypothetical protein IX51_06370 [uncultured archaeon]
MISKKRGLAALILLALVVLQLQPVLHPSVNVPVFAVTNFETQNHFTGNTTEVSVFVPPGNAVAGNILADFLSYRGIGIQSYGLLSSFNMPAAASSQITGELNILKQDFGIQYYVNNGSAVAFPALYQVSNASPLQQTANEYLPSDIRRAYNFTYPLQHNITGKGTTIALVDAYGDPLIKYDVNAFDNLTGLPPTNLTVVYPNNYHPAGYNNSWSIETATDVEWAHALAPGARIVLVIAQNANVSTLDNAVSYVISHRLANIISLSWGLPESQLGTQGLNTFSQVYKYAADSGISVLAATGDYGAYDQQKTLTVNFPSSDPYVLAIGGTSLYPVNNHFEQSAWGGILDGSTYGSGGGYSSYFSRPWWQVAPGFGSAYRGTPDVSMNANKNTGMLVISEAKPYKIGGTSISSPMWADVISLIDQVSHRSLGFVNPLLYQISNTPMYKTSFQDITAGNNGYYNATTGWDPVTGLGTPKVGDLINATQKILSPYGAIALINGTGYDSSGISASLSIGGYPSNETYNGTSFYYLSSYYNSGNFAKFGIEVNNSTISEGYMISQGGEVFKSFTPLGSFTSSTHSFNLNLSASGQYLNFTENGHKTNLNLFLENAGRSRMSFGAEQIASGTNMTRIPYATFTGVTIHKNNTNLTPAEVYETHYSSTGYHEYSTIQIESSSASNYSVLYNSKPSDKVLGTYVGSITEVLYNLTYSAKPVGTFSLLNNPSPSPPQWFVDGQYITGNSYTFASGGIYNITAEYGTGLVITRFIHLPSMASSAITVSSGLGYYSTPDYTINVNRFYHFNAQGKVTVPVVSGTNNITINSKGFNPYARDITGGHDYSATLIPRNVNVSVFTFPGNASVEINGQNTTGIMGMHTLSITPQSTNVAISSPGYQPISYKIDVIPGNNYTRQETLIPLNVSSMAVINGNVTDGLYSFPIVGVNVATKDSQHTYTNNSGYFIMFLNPGNYNISFNQTLYKPKYLNLNITSTQTSSLSVELYPKQTNITNIPSMKIGRAFPLLFYFGYVSWSKYTGPQFGAYQIYISTSHAMTQYRTVTVGNQNTTFAFITGIIPGKNYYITVSVFLTDGEIYGSHVVSLGYSNPFVLLANAAIVIGIIVYAVMATRYLGRMRKKREIKF